MPGERRKASCMVKYETSDSKPREPMHGGSSQTTFFRPFLDCREVQRFDFPKERAEHVFPRRNKNGTRSMCCPIPPLGAGHVGVIAAVYAQIGTRCNGQRANEGCGRVKPNLREGGDRSGRERPPMEIWSLHVVAATPLDWGSRCILSHPSTTTAVSATKVVKGAPTTYWDAVRWIH